MILNLLKLKKAVFRSDTTDTTKTTMEMYRAVGLDCLYYEGSAVARLQGDILSY